MTGTRIAPFAVEHDVRGPKPERKLFMGNPVADAVAFGALSFFWIAFFASLLLPLGQIEAVAVGIGVPVASGLLVARYFVNRRRP